MRKLILLPFLASLVWAQPNQPGYGGAPAGAVACVGAPGNTVARYRQQCQVATTAAIYACNNASGCSLAAHWVAVGRNSGVLTAPLKGDGSGGFAAATYTDIKNLWTTCTGYLYSDGTCSTPSSLPSQATHNGQYLTTDGSTASWATVTVPTLRTWNYSFQGTDYGGVAAFSGNLPAATAPTAKLNAAGDLAVLDFPTAQTTHYWYGSWRMPPSYPANGAISYAISSMCDPAACDSTHAANVYISLSCTSNDARPDVPSYVEIGTPIAITNGALGVQTVTAGTITPGAGGLPSCPASTSPAPPTQPVRARATVKLRVDTNTNGLTGGWQLVAVSFYVQGQI